MIDTKLFGIRCEEKTAMKCNACLNENYNDAKYCSQCGREITETYLGSTKTSLRGALAALVCIALFVFSCIITVNKYTDLFRETKVKNNFTATTAKQTVLSSKKGNDTRIVTSDGISDIEGNYTVVKNGTELVLCKKGDTLYTVQGTSVTELTDCKKYVTGQKMKNVIYLDNSGTLYKASGDLKKISENVKSFCLSFSEEMVIYETGDGTFHVHNLIGSKDDTWAVDMTCDRLLFANSTAVFYEAEGALRACEKGSKNKYYMVDDFSHIVQGSATQMVFVKNDGASYIWRDITKDEEKLCDTLLTEMLLPENHIYTGENFKELLFMADTDSDGESDAVYAIGSDALSAQKIAENVKSCIPSSDCSFIYCLDENDTLYCIDTKGRLKPQECGQAVKDFCLSKDSRTAWFVTEDGLYSYRSRRTTEHAAGRFQNIYMSAYGYVILKTEDDSLCTYKNGEMTEELSVSVYRHLPGMDVCIGKDGKVYRARDNGKFMTNAQYKAENDKKASDNADSESAEN